MQLQSKNRTWTGLALIFLYLGLALPGPFFYNGNGASETFCMFCIETHESAQFNQTNLFIRGVLAASFALIIQTYWTRAIVLLVVFSILYYPLNDIIEMMRTGDLTIAYFVLPAIAACITKPYILWVYESNSLILSGSMVSVIGYYLLQVKFKQKYKLIIPAFILYVIVICGLYFLIFEDNFYPVIISHLVLFALAIVFSLRIYIEKTPYNQSL